MSEHRIPADDRESEPDDPLAEAESREGEPDEPSQPGDDAEPSG